MKGMEKKEEKGKLSIALLQPLILASFQTWGGSRELVVPVCRYKDSNLFWIWKMRSKKNSREAAVFLNKYFSVYIKGF